MSKDDGDNGDNVIRIRGLPWQATKEEIAKFFNGCKIKGGLDGIKMTLSNHGRPSGEAYIELDSEQDYEKALKCHKKHLGSRYIEVFASSLQKMEKVVQKSGIEMDSEDGTAYVRLRGLPFGSPEETRKDILKFFQGLEVARDGIIFSLNKSGRQTGEAYVKFINSSDGEKALEKHKEKIGHRYIEVFKSSAQEFRAVGNSNSQPFEKYSSNGNGSANGNNFMNNNDFYPPMGSLYPNDPFLPKMQRYNAYNVRASPYDRFNNRGPVGGGGQFNNPQNRFINSQPLQQPYPNNCIDSIPSPNAGSSFNYLPPVGASRRVDQMWKEPAIDLEPGNLQRGPMFNRPLNEPQQQPLNLLPSTTTYNSARHIVHMRGLPYKASQADISDFFRPLQPLRIIILMDDSGRPSGEADVEFYTHNEAEQAMNRQKAHMHHRYIELFLHSSPDPVRLPPQPSVLTQLMQQQPSSMLASNLSSSSYGARHFQSTHSMPFQPTQQPQAYSNGSYSTPLYNGPGSMRDYGHPMNSMGRPTDDISRGRI